jgi:hypothetical protein
MKGMESVDWEKIQATGAKPIKSRALRAIAAKRTPMTVRSRTSIPARPAKI